MYKASQQQISADNALAGLHKQVEARARTILEEDGATDPLTAAARIMEVVRQWEKVRDALIRLDMML
jgi:hypothetical protein